MSEERPRALFVDLDGTLADSLPAMRAVYASFLAEHARTGTPTEFDELNGPALPEIIRILKARHALDGSIADLEARYRAVIAERYATDARPSPGAAELLDAAAYAGIDVWVVTSAERALAEAFLDAHGLRRYVRGVVTADGLGRGKPDPAIYLRALDVATVDAADVWVVEDSPNGVRAAAAAGLRTYALAPTSGWPPEAASTISSLYELVAKLDPECDLEPLPSALRIFADAPPLVLSPTTSARIDERWREELLTNPSRFDGTLLALAERRGDELHGHFVPYRYLMAQRRDPELGRELHIVPIAVSGVVICEGSVAFATRTDKTTQYPNRIELVPSGGIDDRALRPDGTIDYEGQLLRELAEETGIDRAGVTRVEPLAVVRDRHDDVVDVAIELEVTASARKISADVVGVGNDEYRALRWIPMDELGSFVSSHRDQLVPASRVMCALLLARAPASGSD